MAAISAAEAALLGMREHQLAAYSLASAFHRSRMNALFERRESLFNSLLLLGAVVHLGTAVFGLLAAPGWAERIGVPPGLALVVALVLIVLLFDALPKVVALWRPAALLRRAAAPLLLIELLLRPISSAMGSIADALASHIAPRGLSPSPRIEDAEVSTMVKMRHASGELPEWEAEVIHEIVKLGDKTAKDVMTPRTDVVAIDAASTGQDIATIVSGTKHRFLPVYREAPDQITGVLDVSRFLFGNDLTTAIEDPVFVPETMAALELFESHLAGPRRMVVVLDEHGGFEGIATTGDIIEDLVRDAVPPDSGQSEIHPLGDGKFLASGAARLEDLEDELGVGLAEDGIDTVGGLVFTHCGEVPKPGESIEVAGLSIQVKQASEKRIEEVLIAPLAKERDGHGEPSSG